MHTDSHNPLAQITKGMKVFDRLDNEIGTVERVQISDDDPSTVEVEAAEPAPLNERDDSFMDNLAEVFAGEDDLPEELRERLMQQGFIRIDSAGLFAADRYVLGEQIMSVADNKVMLKVSKDELIERH